MDLTDTLIPKSDQLNAEDLLTGPRTVTVEKVTKGSVEQPVDIHLVEFPGRPFRPSKTVRRILVAAWGAEATAYTGRRMTLYRDPDVKFGGMDVGGIRVSHLSNIAKRIQIALTTTRGKRSPFVVEPLPDGPVPITPDMVAGFERRIADSLTIEELDAVAGDLKACDLGSHRKQLQAAWGDRRAAIGSATPEQAAPAEPEPPPTDEPMASDDELDLLSAIRAAGKYDDDAAWFDRIHAATGCRITDDKQLTLEQATNLVALFAEDGPK